MTNISDTLSRKVAQEKYGPWAVVAGASDGTGEAYARELAALGINVLLVSRRAEALTALADNLRKEFGVEARTLVQDLAQSGAARNILDASADLDIGMYVMNAGAGEVSVPKFLDAPIEQWLRTISLNTSCVAEAIYGFGTGMVRRGRGGIVIMSSGASLGGRGGLSTYCACKSFEMTLVEGLWSEFANTGVDILCVLAPAMDTPNFHRTVSATDVEFMKKANLIFPPVEIVKTAFAELSQKPLIIFDAARQELVDARIRRLYNTMV